MKVLHGHTDIMRACTVENYPYGGYRTKARFWLETATKGQKKGQTRMMFQTLNPKTGRWNKPSGSTFAEFMVLYADDKGHIHPRHANFIYGPKDLADLAPIMNQLDDRERQQLTNAVHAAKPYNPNEWARLAVLLKHARNSYSPETVLANAKKDRPDDLYLCEADAQRAVEIAKAEQTQEVQALVSKIMNQP